MKRINMKPRTNNIPNRLGSGIVAAAVLAMTFLLPAAKAQLRMSGVAAPNAGIRPMPTAPLNRTGVGISGPGFAGGLSHSHRGHSFGRSGILFPYAYYPSYYDYDDGYDPPAPQPQVVVVPAAAPAPPAPPPPVLEPLLIEWRGDHFERMTLSQKNSGKIGDESGPDYSAKSALHSVSPESLSRSSRPPRKAAAQGQAQSAPEVPRELPPAVLVFRDGRTEEMRSYIIMNGTIYSKADYWTTGAWNRKIQIADLDVPATLKLNQDHGLNFVLPASPNEVVTRP